MKLSDLLYVLNNTRIIVEKEIRIYGYSRKVTVIEGSCENVINRATDELLEAHVKTITYSGAGLIVSLHF